MSGGESKSVRSVEGVNFEFGIFKFPGKERKEASGFGRDCLTGS